MSTELVVRDNPKASRLEIEVDGQVGYAEYRLRPGAISFTHTLVPEALRGRGIGTRLVEAGLAQARARGLEVIPICPFFRAYLRAHPQEQSLLGPEGRNLIAQVATRP